MTIETAPVLTYEHARDEDLDAFMQRVWWASLVLACALVAEVGLELLGDVLDPNANNQWFTSNHVFDVCWIVIGCGMTFALLRSPRRLTRALAAWSLGFAAVMLCVFVWPIFIGTPLFSPGSGPQHWAEVAWWWSEKLGYMMVALMPATMTAFATRRRKREHTTTPHRFVLTFDAIYAFFFVSTQLLNEIVIRLNDARSLNLLVRSYWQWWLKESTGCLPAVVGATLLMWLCASDPKKPATMLGQLAAGLLIAAAAYGTFLSVLDHELYHPVPGAIGWTIAALELVLERAVDLVPFIPVLFWPGKPVVHSDVIE